jgi:hypothetical protein
MFIELSTKEGEFIGNVNLLQRVFINENEKTCVVGWNNNGYIEIEESYEEVIQKINKRMHNVLLLKYTKNPK